LAASLDFTTFFILAIFKQGRTFFLQLGCF